MIDIETLGTRPGCQILSIGAVRFDETGVLPHHQEWIVSAHACREAGLTASSDTAAWWASQPPEARSLLDKVESGTANSLAGALAGLYLQICDRPIWCKGVGFDFPILAEAYRRCGWGKPPWHYRQERCYRTLAALRPDIEPGENLKSHDAVADALHQAKHAARILAALSRGTAP